MKSFLRNKRALVGLTIVIGFALIAIFSPLLDPYDPNNINFTQLLGISAKHLLGTDAEGHDTFSQLLYGTRTSLLVGVCTAGLIVTIQLFFGIFSGYAGGWLDSVLSTITNIFLVLPQLPLLIVITAYVQTRSTWLIIVVLVITGWAWGARVLRSQAIALRDRPFVEAARMSGERRWRIVLFNIVPNMFGIMASNFFGAAVYAIIAEAGLDFLGLGNANAVSWGNMIYVAQLDTALQLPNGLPWMFAPIVCLIVLGTGFALLNFAIDEVADPRLRRG